MTVRVAGAQIPVTNNGGRNAGEFSRVVARQYHESNLRMRARAGRIKRGSLVGQRFFSRNISVKTRILEEASCDPQCR